MPAEPVAPAETVVEPTGQFAKDRVSKQDVITMFRNSMSETLIIQQIQLHGVSRKLSIADVIELHEMGISEEIITAMQTSASGQSAEQVIVEPGQGQSYRVPLGADQSYGLSIIGPGN
jgi:hypothetical protein